MIGAHGQERAEHDFYATDPAALVELLHRENFSYNVWECACGMKHLSNVLEYHYYNVRSSDIVKRADHEIYDFLQGDNVEWDGDIITNPPYKYALEFIYKALDIVKRGNKVAMLLKLQFLEGIKHRQLFENYPIKTVYVFTKRVKCYPNGQPLKHSPAMAFAWFIWLKGWRGSTTIKWI